MSINVRFYSNFTKRSDSTMQPGSSATYRDIACRMKDHCGILSPVIEINYSGNPAAFNYAYISDFGRYYYVSNWSFYQGLWTASLAVDVLASFKTQIGAKSKYILRAASAYDPNILDNIMKVLPVKESIKAYSTSPFVNTISASDGLYIVGIQGEQPASNVPCIGGVCYYPLNYTQMTQLCAYLVSGSFADLMKDDTAGLTSQVVKALQDPAQYIVSAMWFPLTGFPSTVGTIQPRIGWWTTSPLTTPTVGLGANGFAALMITRNMANIPLEDHPQLASGNYGNYLNAAPYSYYTFTLEPFGEISIDRSLLTESSSVTAQMEISLLDGMANLRLYDAGTNSPNLGNLLATARAQVGVPLSIAQISYDIANMEGAALATAAVGISDLITQRQETQQKKAEAVVNARPVPVETPLGTEVLYIKEPSSAEGTTAAVGAKTNLSTILQDAISAGLAYISKPEMKGLNGNVLSYYAQTAPYRSSGNDYRPQGPFIKHTYFEVTSPNIAEEGRPLMQVRQINTLSGFIKCADGDIALPCTKAEQTAVSSFLVGGFFYE